jgi:FG-GAP-like repeat/Secretion system C-terminal sorting domain
MISEFPNIENSSCMKLKNTMKSTAAMVRICLIVIIITFIHLQGTAQQKAFTVNNYNNPLKNYSLAGNKETHPFFVDIDGDGDLDCFNGEYANGHLAKVHYYRNDGTNKVPSFKQITDGGNPLSKVVSNSLSIPYFIDIDGDGDYDCFVGEGNTGAISFYENIGTSKNPEFVKQSAAFNPLSMVKFSASGIANPTFADVDGDGDADCLVTDEEGNENYYKNVGTMTKPQFIHVTGSDDPFNSLTSKGIYNPSFYDWNHDGLPDLFINTTYYQNVGIPGKPAFMENGADQPIFQNKSSDQTYTPLRWVDIKNDGSVQIFQGNEKGKIVYQTISSVNEDAVAVSTSVRVFPNPSKEEFVVNIPTSNAQSVVRVSDLQGKIVISFIANSNSVKVGKGLAPGAYFVQVLQNNKSVFSQKVIKE